MHGIDLRGPEILAARIHIRNGFISGYILAVKRITYLGRYNNGNYRKGSSADQTPKSRQVIDIPSLRPTSQLGVAKRASVLPPLPRTEAKTHPSTLP